MSSFNKVIIMGNLTKDVEIRFTSSGSPVGNVGIAINSKHKVKDQEGNVTETKEEVSFFNLVIWGSKAETLAQYAKKGSLLLVEGRLQQRIWEKEDGKKQSIVDIVIDNFQFVGKKEE